MDQIDPNGSRGEETDLKAKSQFAQCTSQLTMFRGFSVEQVVAEFMIFSVYNT